MGFGTFAVKSGLLSVKLGARYFHVNLSAGSILKWVGLSLCSTGLRLMVYMILFRTREG